MILDFSITRHLSYILVIPNAKFYCRDINYEGTELLGMYQIAFVHNSKQPKRERDHRETNGD